MRRITADEVKAAYRKTGLTPERGRYYLAGCACALGAMHIANGGSSDCTGADVTVNLGITSGYHSGFVDGFDEKTLVWPTERYSDEFRLGYADGQACAAAVFGEGDGGE